MTNKDRAGSADSVSDAPEELAGHEDVSHGAVTGRVVTANRVVGRQLERARRARGWTQEELGKRLAAVTGREWSKAVISAAERSWTAPRVRQFSADEVLAFAAVTGFPVSWFFLHGTRDSDEEVVTLGGSAHGGEDYPLLEEGTIDVVMPRELPEQYEAELAAAGRTTASGMVGRQADLIGWLADVTSQQERLMREAGEVVGMLHDFDDSEAKRLLQAALRARTVKGDDS